MLRTLIVALLWGVSAASAPAAEVVVWQIGKPDRSGPSSPWPAIIRRGRTDSAPSRWCSRSARATPHATGRSSSPGRSTSGPAAGRIRSRSASNCPTNRRACSRCGSSWSTCTACFPRPTPSRSAAAPASSACPPGGGDRLAHQPQGRQAAQDRAGPCRRRCFAKGRTRSSWPAPTAPGCSTTPSRLVCDPEAKMPEPDIQTVTLKPTPFFVAPRRPGRPGGGRGRRPSPPRPAICRCGRGGRPDDRGAGPAIAAVRLHRAGGRRARRARARWT